MNAHRLADIHICTYANGSVFSGWESEVSQIDDVMVVMMMTTNQVFFFFSIQTFQVQRGAKSEIHPMVASSLWPVGETPVQAPG